MGFSAGQIILFRSSGLWYEKVIEIATHGPYVHVAIVTDMFHTIGAYPDGIKIMPAPINPTTFSVISLTGYAAQGGIEKGLAWAKGQLGREYSWVDIFYQGIKFLWPTNPLRFGIEGHYDCSDFVTRYMLRAGVQLPPDFEDPYANSPNDIGRIFKLVPPR